MKGFALSCWLIGGLLVGVELFTMTRVGELTLMQWAVVGIGLLLIGVAAHFGIDRSRPRR